MDHRQAVAASSNKVSLADVARRAGVSPATVSRVLNGTAGVRPEILSRVRQACNELGYMPNGAARALSTRRSKTIGAIVPSIENEGFAKAIAALQRHLNDAGYSLLLASSDYDSLRELHEARLLLSRGVDGMVLVGASHDAALVQLLEQQGVPVVETWTISKDQPSVGFDNTEAAYSVAQYLVNLGHRNVGVIAGSPEHNDRAAERASGIRECLAAHGLSVHSEIHVERPYLISEGKSAIQAMMSGPSSPTAVICGNDQIAFGAMIGAKTMGLAVPQDVSITGFNDFDWAAYLTPSLTTVRVPAQDIGAAAAKYILKCLSGAVLPKFIEIPVNLVVRGSTAPPTRV
ncbi:LacI family DNA-binding transcriptional regulator [Trinickia mobilis]|uniref:LacI family DNA-binding transcriptional regulator n=1 Tax=Trinickia mobilis TaxID=2816356 RepID=UPI001A8EEB24|nr:LacI family DNA-binding transcriptional regulator [Trinickia mobilis]